MNSSINNQEDFSNPIENYNNFQNNEKIIKIDGGEQQVVVACRIRPLTDEEIIQGSTIISHKVADNNHVVLIDPIDDPDDILRVNRSRERQFIFDMAFDAKSTQHDVYNRTTKGLLPGVLNGYNATVFAYGATGAGKTYTMLGTQEEPGIMFRTLHDLFIEISKTSSDLLYQVSMSYLEIYNELIRDLLSPSNGYLELREDAKGGVQIAGISEKVAETPQEVMHMLHKGNKERTQEPTKANKTSSRSHAVLQVNIKQRNKIRMHNHEIRLGKFYMIDLAGSERAAQTQNTGKRMVEGAHINRSLLALGNCINALSEKGNTKYVNYRDSKLTRILKDSLGGNSKTVMIAHISPASIHFEESRNTLVYADRAKYIRTKLRRNVIDVSYHISQYQQIIQELAQEITNLKDQRADLELRISNLYVKNNFNIDDKAKIEESLKLRESMIQSFKDQLKLRKDILELDNAIMDIKLEGDRCTKIIRNAEENISNIFKIDDRIVISSKEELKIIKDDMEILEKKRSETYKEYKKSQLKAQKVKDIAFKKLNTHDQREIIKLLCSNFEFEIKNLETQAEIMARDFQIREKEMIILRLEQHRSLCDMLIQQQRRILQEQKYPFSKELEELYYLYSRDTSEGQLMKDISEFISKGTDTILTKSIPEQNSDNRFTSTWNKRSLNIFDRSNSDKLFYKTNAAVTSQKKASQNHRDLIQDLIPTEKNKKRDNPKNKISIQTPLVPHFAFPKHFKEKNNISSISTGTSDSNIEILMENVTLDKNKQKSYNISVDEKDHNNNSIQPTNNKTLKKHTQGIAAVAAQKKASQHHRDLMQELIKPDDLIVNKTKTSSFDDYLKSHLHGFGSYNNSNEKKHNLAHDGSNKVKKQVKIKESNDNIINFSNNSDIRN